MPEEIIDVMDMLVRDVALDHAPLLDSRTGKPWVPDTIPAAVAQRRPHVVPPVPWRAGVVLVLAAALVLVGPVVMAAAAPDQRTGGISLVVGLWLLTFIFHVAVERCARTAARREGNR